MEPEQVWLNRISQARPRDDSGAYPRILRDELASGEDVWGTLSAEVVKEVLDRYDKVVAIENEAAGVFNAVHESVHQPDVLIVKACSDLVACKNDEWRHYAANAAAACAIGLIEKIGARWSSIADNA